MEDPEPAAGVSDGEEVADYSDGEEGSGEEGPEAASAPQHLPHSAATTGVSRILAPEASAAAADPVAATPAAAASTAAVPATAAPAGPAAEASGTAAAAATRALRRGRCAAAWAAYPACRAVELGPRRADWDLRRQVEADWQALLGKVPSPQQRPVPFKAMPPSFKKKLLQRQQPGAPAPPAWPPPPPPPVVRPPPRLRSAAAVASSQPDRVRSASPARGQPADEKERPVVAQPIRGSPSRSRSRSPEAPAARQPRPAKKAAAPGVVEVSLSSDEEFDDIGRKGQQADHGQDSDVGAARGDGARPDADEAAGLEVA
mmetsp:Transcript_4882/g.15347  ORF Transcript_4882/g.15347 Transcript_4882/m.15347 type:complete len:316 (-) Transcript_4882:50-997(-)